MTAVNVDWSDFVTGTPSNMKIHRIHRDHRWSMRYIHWLQSLVKHQLVRKEDLCDSESDMAAMDTNEEGYEPYEYPSRELTLILHPIWPASQYLRHIGKQCHHVQLSRWIYQIKSNSRPGHNWRKAVNRIWQLDLQKICEDCIHKIFLQKEQKDIVHRYFLDESNDMIINLLDELTLFSTVLVYQDFAKMLMALVRSWERSIDIRVAPCNYNATCPTRLRYPYHTLQQTTIVMQLPSTAGVVPIYQAQLEASRSEPFPKLKQACQPPMTK